MSSNEVYCPRNVTESITELSKYIYNKLRVTIEDRREFIGYFMCIDKNKNIILSATNEYSIKEEILEKEEKENKENTTNEEKKVERLPDECYDSRFLGLIMIPGKYIKKVEAVQYSYF
ncbi:hypothetical protein H8356DRAFT_1318757 [Neocallimastix lanati (nom. inval.)]|uniref:Sm domain-containing protein n=1 Tax=Neocallimastix californiae TaxID=1754190 RepID=A0A1Y1ZL84_9FUNG|nr:hypothetical protein H8356DRAFT_1318757 [Neocallimastix sp. JGI-2020a]ORY10998.1 hypothetical protein LY90DRAFT_708826 [Neocallimastix californiae]|eukprot:ORY10998.1 hypothetical protein LY90DRAFT_708826 [Neocallimastix californiae]